jgi:rubredoxin-NAD+ reductase
MSQVAATLQNVDHVCLYCGFAYNEADGAPLYGVEPGTAWDDLPEDWCCPMCGGEKDQFETIPA